MDWIQNANDDAPAVPLPNEVPRKLDLSHLPLPVLRSGSVEALIAQNEDLMARLTVTLRRLSLLEETNGSLAGEKTQLERQLQGLSDQFLIHQKKDEYWKAHLLKAETVALQAQKGETTARADASLLELRFAELYNASETCEQEFNEKLEWARRRLVRFQRYRKRVRQIAHQLRHDFASARGKLEEQLHLNHELKERMQGLVEHIQLQSKDRQAELQNTRGAYEERISELQTQTEQAHTEVERLSERVNVLDQLVVEQVQLENRAIYAEYKVKELETQYQQDSQRLEEDYLNLRQNADLVTRQRDDLQLSQQKLESTTRDLKAENMRLREQVGNLQSIWDESRQRLENMSTREAALQNLNQELSAQLNQLRRELQAQKDRHAVDDARHVLRPHDATLDWLEKTEERLAQIESGYPASGLTDE
jgi:chromosome segregation ATPase